MSFQNIYYKRTTATSRACYVCNKPTTVCLATSNAVDFLYTCEAHLSDTGFATELLVVDPSTTSASASTTVSKEEIARVKAEWEAKEARKKKAKENEKSGGAEGKAKEETETGGDGKKNDGAKSPSPSIPGGVSSSPTSTSPPSGSSAAATPTHKRYGLHRDFYAMRQAEHRRRRQTKQMQELAPRLPGAPQGSFLG